VLSPFACSHALLPLLPTANSLQTHLPVDEFALLSDQLSGNTTFNLHLKLPKSESTPLQTRW